jgi:hypothetical protein
MTSCTYLTTDELSDRIKYDARSTSGTGSRTASYLRVGITSALSVDAKLSISGSTSKQT